MIGQYFVKMIKQLEENKLQGPDLYTLFQDMVNHNYVWDKPELALHARMMIQKGLINAPYGYIHREVTHQEILSMRKHRKTRKTNLH